MIAFMRRVRDTMRERHNDAHWRQFTNPSREV